LNVVIYRIAKSARWSGDPEEVCARTRANRLSQLTRFSKAKERTNILIIWKPGYLSARQALGIEVIIEAGHAAIHRGWQPLSWHFRFIFRSVG
jgi:hypothetical protein